MITCKITIKIKDYFPKVDTIPYQNYICLFSYGEYEGQIPFLPDDSKQFEHQIKNITSDVKYRVKILDYNDMSLIGICEMIINYDIINQITPPNGFIQEQQKKLLIDLKTKRKIFGTVKTGDIFLNIYAEVILISRTSLDLKKSNKNKKNGTQYTPQSYIKYNFKINKFDYSPKSNKNKLMNSNSEKHNLNNMKQKKLKNSNKYTSQFNNNNLINDEDKKMFNNTNINKSFKNYSYRMHQSQNLNNDLKQQNKKNILDLLQQKRNKEKGLLEKEKNNKNSNDINNNINEINNYNEAQKEGYLTEQNFKSNFRIKLESNYIINNYKLKNKNNNDLRAFRTNNDFIEYKNNDNKFKNEPEIDLNNNKNIVNKNGSKNYLHIKKKLSPNLNINKYKDKDNTFNENLSRTVKNNISENLSKYIYKSKNKEVKMGKTLTNNYYKDNILSYIQNENKSSNNYIDTTLLSAYSGKDENIDIDHIILEKGAELRNDFILQMKSYNNNLNNKITEKDILINQNENKELKNDSNNPIIGMTHFDIDTPKTEKISQYSSTQSLNNALTQDNVKNNCLKLIQFYSLLNLKLNRISKKNVEIKKKLFIIKELISNEIKKSDKIKNEMNINILNSNLSLNINNKMNEKLLYILPRVKDMESNIYQYLFDISYSDEEVIKFREYENYTEQTKIFLLLTVVKNLLNKYGNISQIFSNDINKKFKLIKCFMNYDLMEKEEGEKDYVNLEEFSNEIKLRNGKGKYEEDLDNKFRIIKEVDEDKEEENDEDDEEINSIRKEYSNNNENNEDENEIDRILFEEVPKLYNNKYKFSKNELNEYFFENQKIKVILDKNKDDIDELKIILNKNDCDEEYTLDDFLKLFNNKENDEVANSETNNSKNKEEN